MKERYIMFYADSNIEFSCSGDTIQSCVISAIQRLKYEKMLTESDYQIVLKIKHSGAIMNMKVITETKTFMFRVTKKIIALNSKKVSALKLLKDKFATNNKTRLLN